MKPSSLLPLVLLPFLLLAPSAHAQFPPDDTTGLPEAGLLVMPSVSMRLEMPAIAAGGRTRIFVDVTGGPGLKFKAHGTAVRAAAASPIRLENLVSSPTKTIVDPLGKKVEVFAGVPRFEIDAVAPPSTAPGRYELRVLVDWEACSESSCLMPQTEEKLLVLAVGDVAPDASPIKAPPQALSLSGPRSKEGDGVAREDAPGAGPKGTKNAARPAGSASTEESSIARDLVERGGLLAFLGFLLVGVGMSLTPCVFPLVPITLAVIGANEHKGSLRGFLLSAVHVLGIALTYGALGAAAAASGNALGSFQSHPAVLTAIVVVFVLMALSMFDVFYVQAPAFLRDRLSGRRSKGLAGAFVAGIFAGILAGPCTGPILAGLLTLILKTGDVLYGFLALSTVGLGMGCVLILIGTFSASLPRAGTWMEQVKSVFGLLLFVMALWFFRQLVPAPLFLFTAAFFGIATGLACWQLPDGGDPKGWYALLRRSFAMVALVTGLYLLAGTLAQHGFLLPPLKELLPAGAGSVTAASREGIDWLRDPDEAFALARRRGRTVMLDFRSDNCPQCLELERLTFPDAAVIAESHRFVALKADMTHADEKLEALRARYEVLSWPTILFLSPDGETVHARINGYHPPEKFVEILRAQP